MAFKKGESGNPEGRPKGALDKTNSSVRQLVQKLFSNNYKKLQADLDKLSPRDRVFAMIKLLDFILPKKFDLDIAAEVSLRQFLDTPVSERGEILKQIEDDNERRPLRELDLK